MSRFARVVVPEVPHHITQRGVRKSKIFLESADYSQYTELLIENCAKYGVLIRANAWMPNHIHLVAVPLTPVSFAKAFRRANSVYARWFNQKYALSGYLWQDRYFSCPLDENHFWAAMRYVERNPVRAGLVRRAEEYWWSSAAFHSYGHANPLIDPNWNPHDVIPNWTEWLSLPNSATEEDSIRRSTRSGFPCGSERFVATMEIELGRVLHKLRKGPDTSGVVPPS